jgi:uncharacterized protein
MDRDCVLLLAKVPEKGKVKTRLARDIDEDFALCLYESMVLDTIDTLKKTPFPFRICYFPADALARMQAWLGRVYVYTPQAGADLGERMELAFLRVFREGMNRALLIGGDIPGLSPDILREAFAALESRDAVIGPAHDGGYYLIGFSKKGFEPRVFRDMIWSTDTVFQETTARLQAEARKVHVLPLCRDIDCKEDLQALLALRSGQDADSRTLALTRKKLG